MGRMETGVFDGRPADYFFMLLFNWMLDIIVALFMSIPFIMDPMVMSILYVWCQLNKDTIVNFWFGTQFKAMYLPWVLFGFNMIIAGGGVMELVGILIGHMYFFLMFKYPQDSGAPAFSPRPRFCTTGSPTGGEASVDTDRLLLVLKVVEVVEEVVLEEVTSGEGVKGWVKKSKKT